MEYAIKIDGEYFKDYVYTDKNMKGRFGKVQYYVGDIIDITTTKEVERTEVRRSIGNTISMLYGIEKMKNKKIEIIPIERN